MNETEVIIVVMNLPTCSTELSIKFDLVYYKQ